MSRVIEYHVPPLGLVRTTLYREALDLYNFFEDVGEIARLKNLDHLGIIRRVSEGAHHPRWEYIILLMNLVDVARRSVQEVHLSSQVKLSEKSQVTSGQELLKMWTLLLNLGHLFWTFTTERALMAEVKGSRSIKRKLMEALPDDEVRAYAKQLLRREDVYSFYHILSFLRISKLAENSKNRKFWIDVLKSYCFSQKQNLTLRRLADVYKRTRQIAFFVLDAYYTPSLVGLDLYEVLTDPRRLAFLVDPPDSPSVALLKAIENHLYEGVYLSSAVAHQTCGLLPDLRKRIKVGTKDGFYSLIDKLVSGELQRTARSISAELVHVIKIPFRVEEPFTDLLLPEAKPLREEEEWLKGCPPHFLDEVAVCVWPFADGLQENVDVFVRRRSKRKAVEAALVGVLRRLASLYENDRREHGRVLSIELLQSVLYEKIALSFIRAVLEQLFDGVTRWEFRHAIEGAELLAIFAQKKRDVRHFLSSEIQRLSRLKSPEAKNRKSELLAIRAGIERERARCFAMPMANVYAFDATGKTIGEFDGFWVTLSYGKIRVSILQSKDVVRSPLTTIQRQTEKTLTRLKLDERWGGTFKYIRKKKMKHPHFGIVSLAFQ